MIFYIILSSVILSICGLFLILGFLFIYFSNQSYSTDNKINNERDFYEL